jgi:hypothetical protein
MEIVVKRCAKLALLVVLGTLSCAPDTRCGIKACDIRKSDCQQSASTSAACLLGHPPQQIPVETVTRSQYVSGEVAGTQTGDVARQQRRLDAMMTLDLADPTATPQTATSSLSGRVAAFYNPPTKKITIVTDDGDDTPLDGAWNMSLLVHESTHALQDAAGRLAYPPPDGDRSYDRDMAQGALIEGEASLTETLTTLALFERDVGDVPWERLFARFDDLVSRIAAAAPVPVDLAYSYFAYPFGLMTTYRAYAAQGTAGLDQLWMTPPVSARQIILGPGAPQLASGPVVEDLGPDAVPALPVVFEFVDGDRTGAFVFRLFVMRAERHSLKVASDASLARVLAANLRGDYLSLFVHHDRSGDHPAAAWRLRFATVDDAERAVAYLNQLAPAVDGRNAGGPSRGPSWHAYQIDRDVVVASAAIPDPTVLISWKAAPAPPVVPAAAGAVRPVICPHAPAGAPLFQTARD